MGILNAAKRKWVLLGTRRNAVSQEISRADWIRPSPLYRGYRSQLSNDAHGFLGPKGWRHIVVLVIVVNVEKLESIGDGRLLRLRCLPPCLGRRHHKRLCALIDVPLNLGALVAAVTSQLCAVTPIPRPTYNRLIMQLRA